MCRVSVSSYATAMPLLTLHLTWHDRHDLTIESCWDLFSISQVFIHPFTQQPTAIQSTCTLFSRRYFLEIRRLDPISHSVILGFRGIN